MDAPPLDTQPAPEEPAPQQPPQYFLPLGIVGIVVFILLMAGLATTVMFEQQQRAKKQSVALASPSPIQEQSQIPSPTPQLTYQPQIPGLLTQSAVEIFLAVTRLSNSSEEHRLIRWQHPEVMIALRGQPQPSDRECLNEILLQLNPVMESSELLLTDQRQSLVEVYILPKAQFSSVYVDTPADREAFFVYYTDERAADTALSSVQLLVNSEGTAEERCWYMHSSTLKALGLLEPAALSTTIPPSFINQQNPPFLGSRYSSYDLEMVRILYSPLLTPGLTKTEVERRLLQE